MFDVQGVSIQILIEHLETLVTERALLNYSDAPSAELRNCQNKIDRVEEELMRRSAW